MPETQQAAAPAGSDDVLQKILAPYDAAEEMTTAQLKQLGALALSLIPTDVTKGFAQKLVEKELADIIAGGIYQKRRDWRILHSRMQEVFECMVPPTPKASLGEYLSYRRRSNEDGTRIIYDNSRSQKDSVWSDVCPARGHTAAMAYRSKGVMEYARFVEAVGGRELMARTQLFEQLCLTPTQVIAILDDDKGQLAGEHPNFFIGQSHEGHPFFASAYRAPDSSNWHFQEWVWDDTQFTLSDELFIFRQSIFMPPRC